MAAGVGAGVGCGVAAGVGAGVVAGVGVGVAAGVGVGVAGGLCSAGGLEGLLERPCKRAARLSTMPHCPSKFLLIPKDPLHFSQPCTIRQVTAGHEAELLLGGQQHICQRVPKGRLLTALPGT